VKLLVLHPSSPAQFKEPVKWAVENDWDVKFICQTHTGKAIKGVDKLKMTGVWGKKHLDENKYKGFERIQHVSFQYRAAMNSLQEKGYIPDIILSHSGWGCGLFAKERWPSSKLITYFEWWYKRDSELYSHDPGNQWLRYSEEAIGELWRKNQSQSQEMAVADQIVTPSYWQKSQLPEIFQAQALVINESIQEDIVNYKKTKKLESTISSKKKKQIKLTYGTRGLEPLRCFPQLINELPNILNKYDNISVSIAGEDKVFYGGKLPKLNNTELTWKEWALTKLKRKKLDHRVEFKGGLSREKYIEWLFSSDLHVYLTQPFVASWSLKDAIYLNKTIIASDVPPVQEYCSYAGMALVDHRNPGFLLKALDRFAGSNRVIGTSSVPEELRGPKGAWSDVLVGHPHTQHLTR